MQSALKWFGAGTASVVPGSNREKHQQEQAKQAKQAKQASKGNPAVSGLAGTPPGSACGRPGSSSRGGRLDGGFGGDADASNCSRAIHQQRAGRPDSGNSVGGACDQVVGNGLIRTILSYSSLFKIPKNNNLTNNSLKVSSLTWNIHERIETANRAKPLLELSTFNFINLVLLM